MTVGPAKAGPAAFPHDWPRSLVPDASANDGSLVPVLPAHPARRSAVLAAGRMALAVVGTSRSGTSLLASLLNEHSELRMESERFQTAILLGREAPWANVDPAERYAAFLDACDSRAREAVRFWGNKLTTEVLFHGGTRRDLSDRLAIDHLVAQFPAIPIVFIVRDGRAVVRSKMTRAGSSLHRACRQWVMAFEFVEAFEAGAQPTMLVKFEDLVRHPESVIRQVCDFLGIDYEPRMLRATNSDFLLPEYRHDGFESAKTSPHAGPEGCLPLIGDVLERWGYLALS